MVFMKKYILEVSNLSKSFNGKEVIKNLSFKVLTGDIFGFLGPNGAGKTTTIRMILRLIASDSGSVTINGHDIGRDFNRAIKEVGAIVEIPKFFSYLSGYDNLRLIAKLHPELSKDRIAEVLDIVGLTQRSRDKVKTYSLGMKQRLGLAMALLNRPKLVFLDEPTNGLDPKGIIDMRAMISQLALEQDITFFITTHQLNEVEQICNQVAILKEGELIEQGSVKELLNKDNEYVEVFTEEHEKSLGLLNDLEFVKSAQSSKYGVQVELEKGYSGDLIHFLISQNIKVNYVTPKNQSLEQFFIELTEGEIEHV